MMKLAYTEARQRLGELSLRVLERDGLVVDGKGEFVEERLRTLALTIAAGTSQIQRNIIGERVLGLPEGADAPMNFDLSDDQVALRDGIRSLLEGKFPMSRVREGFDRSIYDELEEAGVFSLRADGFSWADAAVVYEELGRALVPGPLVWTLRPRRDHRRARPHRRRDPLRRAPRRRSTRSLVLDDDGDLDDRPVDAGRRRRPTGRSTR